MPKASSKLTELRSEKTDVQERSLGPRLAGSLHRPSSCPASHTLVLKKGPCLCGFFWLGIDDKENVRWRWNREVLATPPQPHLLAQGTPWGTHSSPPRNECHFYWESHAFISLALKLGKCNLWRSIIFSNWDWPSTEQPEVGAGVRKESRVCLGSDACEVFDSVLQRTRRPHPVRLPVGSISLGVPPESSSLIFPSLPSSTACSSLLGSPGF